VGSSLAPLAEGIKNDFPEAEPNHQAAEISPTGVQIISLQIKDAAASFTILKNRLLMIQGYNPLQAVIPRHSKCKQHAFFMLMEKHPAIL